MFFLSKSKSAQTTYILTSALFCVLMLLFVDTVLAQSYTPISPLPGVGSSVDTSAPSGLVQYFNNIFVVFISIIAVLAVIKLMICGFTYMTSEAISSKEEAKKCMTGVFGGLLIVLLSVLVLQTINPKLLSFDFFGTLQDKVGGVVANIELDSRTDAEENLPVQYGYDNRVVIDQGFCFKGDDGWTGFADIECGPGDGWTAAECGEAGEAYEEGVFNSAEVIESCFSTSDGSRGTGFFCFDHSAPGGPTTTCGGNDSLWCEKAQGEHPSPLSSCYRPPGSNP